MRYATGSSISGDPLALVGNVTPGGGSFVLTSNHVKVSVRESASLRVGVLIFDQPIAAATYDLTNVTVTFGSASQAGWWGAYTDPGSRFSITLVEPAEIVGKAASEITSAQATSNQATPSPEQDYYGRHILAPHLEATAAGAIDLTTKGAVKFDGPELVLVAAENSTRIQTGQTRSTPTRQEAWVTLEFSEARVTASVEAARFGFAIAESSSSGDVAFDSQTGNLETDGTQSAAVTGPTSISGLFQGTLTPTEAAQVRLVLDGQLSGTSLSGFSSTTQIPQPFRLAPWFVGGGLLLFAFGAVLGARVVIQRRPPAMTVDELVALADGSAEEGNYADALGWVRRARALAPRSARLCLDEAYYLGELAEIDAAIARYEEADLLTEDGEATYLAAQLLARTARDPSAVLGLLDRALARTPTLVLDAELDDAFDALRGDAQFRRLLRAASRRFDRA